MGGEGWRESERVLGGMTGTGGTWEQSGNLVQWIFPGISESDPSKTPRNGGKGAHTGHLL